MESGYAVSRLYLAVRELALGGGSIQERLESACDELLVLQSREVIEPAREEFVALIGRVAQVPSLADLPDADALDLARRILELHERVLLLAGQQAQ